MNAARDPGQLKSLYWMLGAFALCAAAAVFAPGLVAWEGDMGFAGSAKAAVTFIVCLAGSALIAIRTGAFGWHYRHSLPTVALCAAFLPSLAVVAGILFVLYAFNAPH